jgi:hypothetical protein
MKGGVLPNTSQQASTSPSTSEENILISLGFEEDELEMFFEMNNVTQDQLVHRYLEIAQEEPYLRNWDDEITAVNADDELGIFKPNGIEYKKRDIAEHTLGSFNDISEGGRAKRIRKKTFKRKHLTNKKKHKRRRTFTPFNISNADFYIV